MEAKHLLGGAKQGRAETKQGQAEAKRLHEEAKFPQGKAKHPNEEIKRPQGKAKRPNEEIKHPQGKANHQDGEGTGQKTTEELTSRRPSVKRKEINIEISMESISFSLFYVVNETEKSLPAYSAEASAVWVARPPDEDRLAHDVVFGHEAPVA